MLASAAAVRRMSGVSLLVGCLVTGALTTPASAQSLTVAVIDLGLGADVFPDTPAWADAVRSAMGRTGAFAAIPQHEVATRVGRLVGGGGPGFSQAELAELREAVRAQAALRYRKPDQAMIELRALHTRLDAAGAHASADADLREIWFEASVALAAGFLELRDKASSEALLRRIQLTFGDDKTLDVETHHPDLVALQGSIRAAMRTEPTGKLRVQVTPADADILIDGHEVDASGGLVEEVLVGERWVVAITDGLASRPQKVAVARGGTAVVLIDLAVQAAVSTGDARATARFPDGAALRRHLGHIGGQIGADLAVDRVAFVGVQAYDGRAQAVGYLVDVEAKRIVQSGRVLAAEGVSVSRAEALSALLARPPELQGRVKPWYTRWLGWVGVGVAVGAGVTAAIFYADYLDKEDIATCTGAAPPCADQATRDKAGVDGNQSRDVAAISVGVAGVGLITGVLAFVLMVEDEDPTMAGAGGPRLPQLQVVQPIIVPGGAGLGAAVSF